MWKMVRALSKKSIILILVIPLLSANESIAQEKYPTRPLTVIYGYAPGGAGDVILRVLCRAAEKDFGQPIVIENKIGGNGAIGMNYVLKSKPDGYTLGLSYTSHYLINPHLRKLPFNVLTDTVDIVTIFKYNFGLAVRADAPWNNYEEVLAYAKNNPGKFSYGTPGVGSPQMIAMERIAKQEGTRWAFVPFKSPPESITACLGGHTSGTIQASIDLIPHLQSGKLKLILVLNDKRWEPYPNIPCILEKGYNFYAFSYGGLHGPKGIAESILNYVTKVFEKAKKDPTLTETLQKFNLELGDLGGKEYTNFWKLNYEEMGNIIKALGLQEK